MIEFLYTVSLLELFIGGGGRLLEIGPGTLRMVLFAPCALIGLFALFAKRRITSAQKLAVNLVLAYLAVHLIGMIVGSIRGRDVGDMFTEFQTSLYWLAAPFFALVLQTPRMVRRSAVLVEISGVVLALGYIGVLVGTLLGYIDVISLFAHFAESGEFVGRGENLFFYKGFLYLGVAIVFLVAGRRRYWRTLTVFVGTALVLTLTRGFLLATGCAILLMLIFEGRKTTLLFALLLVLAGAFFILEYMPSQGGGPTSSTREMSNNQRIVDTQYVADTLTWRTFAIGEGFGTPINGRPAIENTFVYVFWKLGTLGVLFWLCPIVVCTYYFRKVRGDESCRRLAGAFYFGVVLIYVQTLTNPYLNNPIGLSFVMVAIFSLKTLSERELPALQPAAGPEPVALA